MRNLRILLAGPAAILLLVACGDARDRGSTASSGSTDASTAPRSAQLAASRAAQELVTSCRADDDASVIRLVAARLRTQPWGEACAAFAQHQLSLREQRAAIDGNDATVHVRLEGADRTYEEDWYFNHRNGGWQLSRVPPVMTGGWDDDGHQWLHGALQPDSPTHPDRDGHDHGTSPTTGHFDGDGHDHGTSPTTGHFDGDGHDHNSTSPTTGHFDGDGHDHNSTSPTTGHFDGDGHNHNSTSPTTGHFDGDGHDE